jgi:hypothetical protein
MKCQACEDGVHYLCGLQTWCDCECDPFSYDLWGPSPDDDIPHSDTCTCETCLQNHPERDVLYSDGEYFDWSEEQEQP